MDKKENINVEELIEYVNNEFNGILRANLYEVGLKEDELKRVRAKKRELRQALKNCGIGDIYSKNYIKSSIKNILLEKRHIDDKDLSNIIDFENIHNLSCKDKFDILLFQYKKQYDSDGFIKMVEEFNLMDPVDTENGFKYEISEDDIDDIFRMKYERIDFGDKLEIITQRIYEKYRGLGIVDELRDMRIDGVSGGVSGEEGNYHNVWAFIKGKTVHISFLDFESEKELERVCMNIYRYNHPGQLSMSKGYIVNEMKDHSRVVVVRPPFCESFAFFVRKFDTIESKRLEELITDKNAKEVIEILKWIVKGCQICGITGTQGSGKTTLLMALIAHIHPAYTLRIQELAFELHLRETYSDRNIITFQETDFISGQEGLDIQKKTDGTVNILGEVASAPVASWLVQMGMVASLFTMFTHHAKTTESLIKYLRNCLLSEGSFTNEMIALEQVVDVIRFDIHMEKDINGHRYIERISEIVPDGNSYKIVDIVEFVDNEYVVRNNFSKKVSKDIIKHLTKEEGKYFSEKYNL